MSQPGSDDRFLIVPQDVMEAQAALTSVTSKMKGALENIEANATTVLNAWTGEAREAFRDKQARWNEDASEIQRRLFQLVQGVETGVMSYVHADNKGVGIILDGA